MQQVTSKSNERQTNVLPFIPEGDFYFTKGVEAFQKRKFDIAVKWLKKAIDHKPDEALYQCQLSIIYTEIGAYHAANDLLMHVLKISENVDCYYLLANNFAHLGLLNDAKKYANLYIQKDPDGEFKEEVLHLLELIDIEEEDTDEALEEEDELLIYQETVFYHMEHYEWEKALHILKEMLVLFPEHPNTKHDYTQALFFLGDEQQALNIELEAIQTNPDSLYGRSNLALFYYYLGKEKEYNFYIEPLLKVYPIHEQQKLRIAITMARTGKFVEAVRRFKMLAKDKVSGHLSYFRFYALTVYHNGEHEKAISIWKEGCKRHPELISETTPWN
ncbi:MULTISPECIES: hypothetical protein [Clostridia]|uniref:tetratricopeptide repeat protein n=1 Tax=Clostridia TaxID=186801 RepID=UPI000EA03949|nr:MULTISPECIES: hypothetical protein [Clostridia]NBJ69631.1 hypothetical protein [Roseburia sp. 1XD42-34]RKI78313.1 hypothetical protein D7V87_09020 [Clostridium sp. 1xD42-85]